MDFPNRYTEIFLPLLAAHLGSGNDNDRIFELQEKANSHLALRYINAKNATVYKKHFQKKEEQDCYLAPFKALGEDVCSALPIPPLDVAFCWALHRLSPIDYEEDCTRLFGMKLETENGLDYVNAANSGDAPSAVARLQWSCFANSVRSLEKKKFGVFQKYCKKVRETFLPQYLWPRYSIANSLVGNELPPIRYNIKAASRRQKQFLYNISHSYFDQDASLEKGVIRYKKFLTLMRDHPGTFMVPCYDIDLVWHAHILRDTGGYARNTKEFVGTFVNHKEDEDRSQGGELQTGFQTTNHLWERVYGEVYEDSDTNYKGKLPDRQARVFDETSTLSVKVDHDWAKSFAAESGVCRSCQKDICTHMDHEQCRALLGKAVLLGRGGQVKGGACGALFFKEYVLYASTVVDAGGAFGAAAIEYKRSVEPLRHEFIRSFRDMYAVRQRPISRYGPGDGYYGNGGGHSLLWWTQTWCLHKWGRWLWIPW